MQQTISCSLYCDDNISILAVNFCKVRTFPAHAQGGDRCTLGPHDKAQVTSELTLTCGFEACPNLYLSLPEHVQDLTWAMPTSPVIV